jgi:hypothetical protein
MLNANSIQAEVLVRLHTADERSELVTSLRRLKIKARRWYFAFMASASILLIGFLGITAMALSDLTVGESHYLYLIVCLSVALLVVLSWPWAQHSQKLSSIMFQSKHLPATLVALFEGFATSRQVVTADGEMVDGRLFESALALLLLSTNPFDRRMVRTPDNVRYGRGLFVLPEVSQIESCSGLSDQCKQTGVSSNPPEDDSIGRPAPALPDDSRQPGNRESGQSSKHSAWVMALALDHDELVHRIQQLDVPGSDGRHEIAVKLALSAALPALLVSNRGGALAQAVRAGGEAVRRQFGQAGVFSDSPDWIRKLIAPPAPWLKAQLSTSPEQTLLRLEFPERPRLPRV